MYGAHAVRLIVERKFGEMICYNPPEMGSVPIIRAVNKLRTVDPNGHAVLAARALGISFGDRDVTKSPFAFQVEAPEAATCDEVELNAEFTLDMADAATEEALAD
jgi:6-phosphofructokinase 1